MKLICIIFSLLLAASAKPELCLFSWSFNDPREGVTNYWIAASSTGPVSLDPRDWEVFASQGNTNRGGLVVPEGFKPKWVAHWAENSFAMSEPQLYPWEFLPNRTFDLVNRVGSTASNPTLILGFTNVPPVGDIDWSHDLIHWHDWIDYWMETPNYVPGTLKWEVFPDGEKALFWRIQARDE